jgi:hypothetical protein
MLVEVNVNINIVAPSDPADGYRPFGFSTFLITVVPIARTINRGLMVLTNTFHRNLATWSSIRKERSRKEKLLRGVYKPRRIRMRKIPSAFRYAGLQKYIVEMNRNLNRQKAGVK